MRGLRTVTWRPGLTIDQDPQAVEVYRLDWSDWLAGEALVDVEYQVEPDGLTVQRERLAGEHEDVRVSGGAEGKRYAVTFHATSSTGRRRDRTVWWRIMPQ